jgi:hypothetical protein
MGTRTWLCEMESVIYLTKKTCKNHTNYGNKDMVMWEGIFKTFYDYAWQEVPLHHQCGQVQNGIKQQTIINIYLGVPTRIYKE